MKLKFRLLKKKQARNIEVDESISIEEFDLQIRRKWGYDTWDHCSSFYKKSFFGMKEIACVYPDGTGKNSKEKIIKLKLKPGTEIKYVYDYGEYKESIIIFQGFF